MPNYLRKVSEQEEHNAYERYCHGGCAILAYALWKLLPDWQICIFSGEANHCVLYNPHHDMTLDFNGLLEFEVCAETHFGRQNWREREELIAGREPDKHSEYEDDDEECLNADDYLDLNDSIEIGSFFEMTNHYDNPPKDVEHVEQLIKDFHVQFWANRIVKLARKENPEVFIPKIVASL